MDQPLSTHSAPPPPPHPPPTGTHASTEREQVPHHPCAQILPPITGSHMANAVMACTHKLEAVVYPLGMPRQSRHEQQSQQRKVAMDPHHMTLVQDSFSAANSLTILERKSDYPRLKKAEEMELEMSVSKTIPTDGSLPPRAEAVTILDLSTVKGNNVHHVLDAAQFLARDPDASGNRACATTRMTFLSGETAHQYVKDHIRNMKDGEMAAFDKQKETTFVCLSWYGAVEGAIDNEVELCSLLVAISFCSTAAGYVSEIRSKIALAWDARNYYPTGRLSRVYSDPENAKGAYVQGAIECANDFWKITRAPSVKQKSQYASESPQYVGYLEFTRIYLRIIPRHIIDHHHKDPNARLTDPAVFHGMLLCQKGWKDEAAEFCKRSHDEEVARSRRGNVVYGLREPKDQQEDVTSIHILTVKVEPIEVGTMVTSFGLKAAPGKSLARSSGPFSMMRMQRCLLPLDKEFLQYHCVCPVARECCDPPDVYLALAQFEAFEQALEEFEGEFQEVGSREKKRTLDQLQDQIKSEQGPPTPRIRVTTPPPNEDEIQALKMFHMDLSHPAVRLGDAYTELARRKGPSNLTAFFSAMSAHVGGDESINSGFAHATQMYRDREKVNKEIQSLNDEIASLKSVTDTVSNLSNVSNLSTDPFNFPDLSLHGKETLLRGIGRSKYRSVSVSFPLTKETTKAVIQLTALWPGLDRNSAYATKSECREQGMDFGHTTLLASLSAVLGTLLRLAGGATTTRVLLLYESSTDAADTPTNVQFYTVASNAEPVSLGVNRVLNADLSTTPVLGYNEESGKLSYYSHVDIVQN